MSDFIGMARACSFHGREIFNLTSISCLGYLSLLSTWSHFVASVSRAIADQLWTHLPCRSLSVLLRSVVHGDIIVLCDLTLKTFPDLEIISCIYTFGKSFNSKVMVSRDRYSVEIEKEDSVINYSASCHFKLTFFHGIIQLLFREYTLILSMKYKNISKTAGIKLHK